MPVSKSAESVARELIEAFCAADTQRMRSLLADDLRAYITNRDGGVDEPAGCAAGAAATTASRPGTFRPAG